MIAALDELDLDLIRELDIGPRRSFQQLADSLHTSRNTVRRRTQRLLDEKIVTFVTITSPPALGYRISATMAITTRPGDADAVATRLASLANVSHLLTTTGRYDIVAAALFHDLDSMLDFMDKELGSIPQALSTEVMIGVNWMKFCLNPLTSIDHAFPVVPSSHKLDALDTSIISELENAPGQTNLELAAKLAVSRPTLKKRIQALQDDGIIRIGTLVDPSVIGFDVLAILLIKVQKGRIKSTAARLTELAEISNLIITAGSHDMIAYANFRDTHHMSEFINDQAGRIADIVRVEAVIVHGIKKLSFSLLTLGLEPAGNSPSQAVC
ncbi:MAG: Lrp/AsnC family transcriptional regulator [Dehalococcoidia bacterium]